MLKSSKPDSKGKAAALARARHLTEFCWTPLRDVPTYTKEDGKTFFPAGVEVRGIPYSSMELTDKFICENVSLESFISVIENPDSALYNKDLGGGTNGRKWTFFGIVCNSFVRYALGIKPRVNTKCWFQIPGMRKIAECGKYSADDIELCDILHSHGNGRNHVALITDLLRDESGAVRQVEVSEAVAPSCKRACYETEEFYEKYKLFGLCRYELIDCVPKNDLAVDKLLFDKKTSGELPKIAVDYGNKSNYAAGEEVVISVFSETEEDVEIRRNGEVIERVAVKAPGNFKRKFERGYYTATGLKSKETVEFCVKRPEITFAVEDTDIVIKADSCDDESRICHMDFREYGEKEAALVKIEELTEEEKNTGIIKRKIPDGAYTFKIYFENKYGIWTHPIIKFNNML